MADHPQDRDPDATPDTAPADEAATGFPEPPGRDPGYRSRDRTPHSSLNTPVGEPDPTEWPDPYDRRGDPRAPADEMAFPGDGSARTQTGSESTSAPHPHQDPEAEPTD